MVLVLLVFDASIKSYKLKSYIFIDFLSKRFRNWIKLDFIGFYFDRVLA